MTPYSTTTEMIKKDYSSASSIKTKLPGPYVTYFSKEETISKTTGKVLESRFISLKNSSNIPNKLGFPTIS